MLYYVQQPRHIRIFQIQSILTLVLETKTVSINARYVHPIVRAIKECDSHGEHAILVYTLCRVTNVSDVIRLSWRVERGVVQRGLVRGENEGKANQVRAGR